MLHNRPLADIIHALSVIPHRHRPDQQREPDRARHAPHRPQHQETARQRLCRGRQFGLPEGEDSHQAEEEVARDSHDGEGVEDAVADGLDGAVEVAAGRLEEDGAGEASEGEVGEAGDGGEEDEGDDEGAVQGFVREDVQEEEAEGDFEGDEGEGEEAGGPFCYLWEVVSGQGRERGDTYGVVQRDGPWLASHRLLAELDNCDGYAALSGAEELGGGEWRWTGGRGWWAYKGNDHGPVFWSELAEHLYSYVHADGY